MRQIRNITDFQAVSRDELTKRAIIETSRYSLNTTFNNFNVNFSP